MSILNFSKESVQMFVIFVSLIASKVQLSLTEERQFIQWMRMNNKIFIGDEYHFRLGIFISNARYFQEFNKRKGLTYTVGINQFSCHTPTEYKSILGVKIHRVPSHNQAPTLSKKKSTPETFDWRDEGVVNPVKNQGSCGSCWAFSSIATSESAYAISTGNLLTFSEQNLVDCAPAPSCEGCSGGWPIDALTYIIEGQNGRFNSEDDYPYAGVDGRCSFDSSKGVGRITNLIDVVEGDENDLKEKVAAYGVASICIPASNTPFMSYTGGILDDDDCIHYPYLDHAVAAVGYGMEDGIDYWIVRNSWGKSWGEDGYVRMIRNKNNKCLIASKAFVAVDYQ